MNNFTHPGKHDQYPESSESVLLKLARWLRHCLAVLPVLMVSTGFLQAVPHQVHAAGQEPENRPRKNSVRRKMMKPVSTKSIRSLLCLFLVFFAAQSLAAVPASLSYQGYLTDTGGVPVDATLSITFRLYDAETGGSLLWNESQSSVAVTNGLFSVELGKQSAFPANLFSNPLWLGIEVGTDGEMTPRKPLTSVGFAFRAESAENDADTLAGLGCTTSEVAKWNGSAWTCAADDIGSSDWASLTNVPAGFADGVDNDTDTNTDTLAALSCATSEVAMWNGSAWVCSADLVNLQATVASLQSQISTLQAENTALQNKLQYVSVSGTSMYISGANFYVQNGTGGTDGAVNGLGNLIVGYNELRGTGDVRTGSHNLILGKQQNFSSYAGLIAGFHNETSASYATVAGGKLNTASGGFSSVLGGEGNQAIGTLSTVVGGGHSTYGNKAYAHHSAILGGIANTAGQSGNESIGEYSAIAGGDSNTTTGGKASVSGGKLNTASALESTVSGGKNNTASGFSSTVSGGESRSVSGQSDWRAGASFQDN